MQKTQLQQKQVSKIAPKKLLGAFIALIAFFLLVTSVIGLAEKHRSITRRIDELHVEQKQLQEKKNTLVSMNETLDTLEGKEQLLRNKYNLVRPGEEIIIITQPQETEVTISDDRSRVQRWWSTLMRGLGLKKD